MDRQTEGKTIIGQTDEQKDIPIDRQTNRKTDQEQKKDQDQLKGDKYKFCDR